MEFGIFLILQSPQARPSKEIYQRGIEITQAAEILGFSRVWLAEHHFSTYSYSSSPLVLLGHLAAKTRKIRLGTAIIPLPLHHPLLVAEEVATVDVLSNGRIDLGIGKGYQYYQYQRLGVEDNQDHTKFSESLDVLTQALKGQPFHYQGKHFTIPETLIYPQPLQQTIPCWYVVNTKNKDSITQALQRDLNIFTGVLEPMSQLTHISKTYPDLFRQYNQPRYIGTQRPVFVSTNSSLVRKVAEETRWNARVSLSMRHNNPCVEGGKAIAKPLPNEPSIEEIIEEYMIAGSPEECIRKIKHLQGGLGINYFNCSFWFGSVGQQQVLESMALFSKEVMPAFAVKNKVEELA
jgi:alkanesulfonate monooxygenase SsuD/methylene tetrahydromethanopterin reductase-like flavin-dependent oxidoreductase (luciferase family)